MPPQQGVFAVPMAALSQQQPGHSQQSYGQSELSVQTDELTAPDEFGFWVRRRAAQEKAKLPRHGGY